MKAEPQVEFRKLLAGFLDAHRGQILSALSSQAQYPGGPFLPPEILLDLIASRLSPPPGSSGAPPRDLSWTIPGYSVADLTSGTIALWATLHNLLRDIKGPHSDLRWIHRVLALAGDTVDGIIGELVDRTSRSASESPLPDPGTLVELGRIHREYRMLNRLVRDVLQSRTPAQVFRILMEGILGVFHIRSLLIAAVDQRQKTVEVMVAHPLGGDGAPVGWQYHLRDPEILCEVARSGKYEAIEGWDARFHERVVEPSGKVTFRQRPKDFNTGSVAFFIPLLAGGRTVGVVATGSSVEGREIVEREIARLGPFLDQAGVSVMAVSEILERQRAEQSLLENEARLNLALDAGKVGTWASDMRTGSLTWSASVAPLFGLPPAAHPKSREEFYDLVHPEDRQAVRDQVARAIEAGSDFSVEHRVSLPDGSVRWVSTTGRLFRDRDGRLTRMMGAVADITDRKLAEQAKMEAERVRVVMEMAGGAAHEINQPLTAVIGLTDLVLMETGLGTTLKEDIRSIRAAAERIREIVRRMDGIQRYVTRPYVGGARIVDFDAASRDSP